MAATITEMSSILSVYLIYIIETSAATLTLENFVFFYKLIKNAIQIKTKEFYFHLLPQLHAFLGTLLKSKKKIIIADLCF